MTQEEKAKRYDEAVKFAKIYHNSGDEDTKTTCETMFPALKESEDDRIRKVLIRFHKSTIDVDGIKGEDIIAWLEKQGEQKDILEDAILDSNEDGLIADIIRYKREKQGEQKPAEWDILSAKKGDMLSDGNIVLIVDSIEEFEGRPIINSWYFADSKKFYGKGTSECDRWDVHGFRTATETECNYLLKMIDNAGYEWDAEKKELKKIEQKPAWGEKDEQYLLVCKNALAKYQTTDKWDANIISNWLENKLKSLSHQPKVELTKLDKNILEAAIAFVEQNNHFNLWRGVDKHTVLSALRSLSPQNRWKPSDEQISIIEFIMEDIEKDSIRYAVLNSILEQLKKLREE